MCICNQGTVPAEAPARPDHGAAFIGEMTAGVNRSLAHLNAVACTRSRYRQRFSSDVVGCLLEDVWPYVIQVGPPRVARLLLFYLRWGRWDVVFIFKPHRT